ncbi:IRF3 factor, partial [Syrrhaptes paradoxus]|nr:IRF3 factor [Syrrhaptes paradoxus]
APAHRDAPKLRFGPWLVSAVSSGNYQGLCWTDPARSTFRVPWKHNARKDVTSDDVEVFKVGGLGPGSPPVHPTHPPPPPGLGNGKRAWKTNFRCALRSTGMFELLEDRSKCGDDPHKVF